MSRKELLNPFDSDEEEDDPYADLTITIPAAENSQLNTVHQNSPPHVSESNNESPNQATKPG